MAQAPPTKNDVLLAILSMDAYSRGTSPLIKLEYSPGVQLSETIGGAVVGKNSDSALGGAAIASGFSATEYTLGGGRKIIAYRGTDFTNLNGAGLADAINGWTTSAGLFDPNGTALNPNQPFFAQRFYELVSGRNLLPGASELPQAAPANLTITGHSLGGVLANDNALSVTPQAAA